MKVEWSGDSEDTRRAVVGRFLLAVERRVVSGRKMWRGYVGCCGVPVRSEHHSDWRAAEAWCESRLAELVAPFVDAARAEERESCAALVDQLAVEASSSWHRHQEVLRDAAAAIRARSNEPKP